MRPNPYRVVLVTAPDAKTARALARGLVGKHLAACVSEIPGLTSHYRWEGRLQQEREVLLVIKTRASLWPKVKHFIKERHPARVPEIIALTITEGSRDYLAWLSQSTRA